MTRRRERFPLRTILHPYFTDAINIHGLKYLFKVKRTKYEDAKDPSYLGSHSNSHELKMVIFRHKTRPHMMDLLQVQVDFEGPQVLKLKPRPALRRRAGPDLVVLRLNFV